MNASHRPAIALLAFTFLVAGASEARPLLTLGSALLVADAEDKQEGQGEEKSDDDATPVPAASDASEAPAADAAPATQEPADASAVDKALLPTVKGAVLGAVVGAVLVGGASFIIFPMFSPELEQLGIGDGQAWMVSIWSVAIGVPVGALLGGAIGAGTGYAIATLEE